MHINVAEFYSLPETLVLRCPVFLNNKAGMTGRVIYTQNKSLIEVENCSFSYNVVDINGGCMGTGAETEIYIRKMNFTNNSALTGSGGVISMSYKGKLTLTSCLIDGNKGWLPRWVLVYEQTN